MRSESEVLKDMAWDFGAKAELHFAQSSDPLFVPQEMFDSLQPYLNGTITLESDDSFSDTDLPETYRIIGWLPG